MHVDATDYDGLFQYWYENDPEFKAASDESNRKMNKAFEEYLDKRIEEISNYGTKSSNVA